MTDRASISLTGRRAVWYARISRFAHALEPPGFGLALAGGIYLATRQAGALVVHDRRGAAHGDLVAPGLLLLVGVTLVAASLLFFHRKGRMLRQRLFAAAVATTFFAAGYARELGGPAERLAAEYPLSILALRGADFPEKKPDHVRRVAVVGGSFVSGAGVDEQDSLPAKLGSRLRERFPATSLEVLNLGVPRNHLASHLAMVHVAERRLGADVIVLCLDLPRDLSAWDAQAERREHARASGFSFMSFLFGRETAVTLWDERNLARDLTPQAVDHLRSEAVRFAAERTSGAAPLAIFTYSFEAPGVTEILRSIPGAVIVPPVSFDAAHHLPGDGSPTASGNDVFARRIAGALEPAWLGER